MIAPLRICILATALAAIPAAHAQVMVKGDWIALSDVAPVTGAAAGILLAPSPPPGQALALDPAFITSVARGAGIELMLPDKPVMVSRAGVTSATTPRQAASAPVAPQPASATLPGAPAPGNILVLVRDIKRGDRISREDLDWTQPTTPRTLRGGPEDMSDAIGLEAKRSLKAGAAVVMTDLKQPSVIRKGEAVKLVYVSRGLRLTVDAQAQADAAAGDTVRVLNTYSRRTIDAVAAANGEAHVLTR
jgi:flagella basal body P-ring formation protein FlgA